MKAEKSDIERKKEELLTFINSEEFDELPLEDQLRDMLKAGQALIDFAREVKEEIEGDK